MSDPPGFLAAVLAWLQQKDPQADRITEVRSWATDMAGDTENGWYEQFYVNIQYTRSDGTRDWREVEGVEMESLWQAVVGDYRAE